MHDIIGEYEQLSAQNPNVAVPGTPVPGHGVTADAITATAATGTGTVGVAPGSASSTVIGTVATGVNVDTADPKSMGLGDPAGGYLKTDGVDPKSQRTGEKTDSIGDGAAGSEGNKEDLPDAPAVKDDFGKLPKRLQVFVLAEEVAGKVEILRHEGVPNYYDDKNEICIPINPKPSPGGNITKLLRDNVSKFHLPYVDDGIGNAVYSWYCDSDEWIKEVGNFNNDNLVAFNNGYFDLEAGCFIPCKPHDLGFYFTTKINANFVETPLDPLVQAFLKSTYKEEPMLILAACGIMLSNFRDFKKAFFFVGPSNSGKTTLTNFTVSSLFPTRKDKSDRVDSAVRGVSLKRLGGRFSPAVLMDAHFSWSGDVGAAEFTRPAFDNFKTLTGRDEFEAENKFKALRIEIPRCALAFNCNTFPKIPLAWDFDGTGSIDDGAGRSRFVVFHTQQKITEEMQMEYKKKHGKAVDQVLAEDRDAIVSEMIRQAGRFYRGELFFPKASFDEVYTEGKSLKERFFFFMETQFPPTGSRDEIVPLQEVIAAYKDAHPDEILPYKDALVETRGFGALLNYVCKLDPRYVQDKKQVPGYPNPVSCLIGCRRSQVSKKNAEAGAETP